MALEQACCVAAARVGPAGTLRVANAAAATYPEAVWDGTGDPAAPPPNVSACATWHRYVLAAMHGVWEQLHGGGSGRSSGGSSTRASSGGGGGSGGGDGGLALMVGSSIPPGAGLSSSSALVVASALALLALQRAPLPPAAVADLARR
jgi:galactokinase